jgi:putative nucleotidyltransferase with HDIG domain
VQPTQRLQPRPWSGLTEANRDRSVASSETSAAIVVTAVTVGAIGALASLALASTSSSKETQTVAFVLAALGILAELFSYRHRQGATGSTALIPFAACALVEPSAWAVAWIVLAATAVQFIHRRNALKGLFNVSQIVLGLSLGILCFKWAGGESFWLLRGEGFAGSLRVAFTPAFVLASIAFLINSLCVSAVLSAAQQKPFIRTWKASTLATIPIHFVTVLIVFYVAWLSINLGAIGTAGMAVPMLAVRQLYRTTMELTNVTEELLDLMVAAIEARDPYTSGHSKRVSAASRIIAKAAGLSPEKVERVAVAALLHDVGKIDQQFARVLAKEGRLTPEEWTTMKKHPVRSAELVAMLSSLQDIVAAVRHHHENWDGTGYPDAVQGEAIPFASRVIMFADTLDAITTDRPYRKALDVEEARREFVKFRGKQFDPTLCDVVISAEVWAELYQSVIAGHQEYASSEEGVGGAGTGTAAA